MFGVVPNEGYRQQKTLTKQNKNPINSTMKPQRTILVLLSWLILTPTVSAHGDEDAFLPSTEWCDTTSTTSNTGDCSFERVWIFPPVYVSLVCKYDFRQDAPKINPYHWSTATSDTIQATWGPFLDYLTQLVPQVVSSNGSDNNIPRRLEETTGLYWLQGGEGRPGWEIPPCGTNRTLGVLHLSYLTVVLNATTADPDLYNAGLSYQQVAAYINQDSIRAGIEQFVCDDLERLDIGFDRAQYTSFFPQPEEICPRQKDNDTIWEEGWQGYLLLSVLAIVAIILVVVCAYCWMGRRRTAATTTPSTNHNSETNGNELTNNNAIAKV